MDNLWAVVLAAGEGKRLSQMTTDSSGVSIPKQYCSLRGGPSLLLEAIRRAHSVVPQDRICTIVAHQHRRWWQPALPRVENLIVQPHNRGTANGILLSLLSILEREPFANLVFVPSDHYVVDEAVLARALRDAVRRIRTSSEFVLLGIEPDDPDPELGYIVPGAVLDRSHFHVRQFVEKPTRECARDLIAQGSVWNSFLFAAAGNALLGLFRNRYPELVEDMATSLAQGRDEEPPGRALCSLYERLPEVDFSRHIIEAAAHRMSVGMVPRCGWTDLGTPKRVAATLKRLRSMPLPVASNSGFVNLADRHDLIFARELIPGELHA
jgi:mannose-1-phosphate guanylyltransferase